MRKPVITAVQTTLLLLLAVSSARCDRAETQPAADAWKTINPRVLAEKLAPLLDPKAASPDYWHTKPPLPATFYYARKPVASKRDREDVCKLKAGEFRPSYIFDWQPLGVPPPWGKTPDGNTSWDFYRHALRWTEPLVKTWAADGDADSINLMKKILTDWIDQNGVYPGQSDYAWYDHAVAGRLRMFCWFWEVWRASDDYDPEFAKLLLAAIYQHAQCTCDPKVYPANSNHGLDMTGSLLAAALTLPEFKESADWEKLGLRRLSQYAEQQFSPEGFHLEQSPFYHRYVLDRLGRTAAFLHANGRSLPDEFVGSMRRAEAAWHWLRRTDGTAPTIGDTPVINRSLRAVADDLLGGADAMRASLSPPPNPRDDGSHFLMSFAAGYAIFTTYLPYDPPQTVPDAQTHVVFKCNSFQSPHYHHDALSFVLYALGREWLVDSGQLNYEEETAPRLYMRSARAHNVVLIDDEDFDFHPLELIDSGRDARGDFVSVRHKLPQAVHTRTFRFIPPRTIEITDELEATDGQSHVYAQLFHAAPDLTVEPPTGPAAELAADTGERCRIEQNGTAGEWSLIKGQTEPVYQGWYSPKYNELQQNAVLCYRTPEPLAKCTFKTRITVLPAADAEN